MFTRPRLLPVALTLLVLGIGAVLSIYIADSPVPPSEAELRVAIHASIQGAIQEALPATAHSCGYVFLREDRSESMRCVKEFDLAGSSYWVASEAQGLDSLVWVVVYRGEKQSMQQLVFDSYVADIGHATASKPTFKTLSRKECKRLVLGGKVTDGKYEYIEPAFSCE